MVTQYWRAALSLKDRRLVCLIIGIVLLSFVYKFGIGAVKYAANSGSSFALGISVALIAACFAVAVWHRAALFKDLWLPLRVLLRGTSAVIFVQVAIDALHPAAWPSNLLIGVEPSLRLLIGLAFAGGALAMWRPAFVLPMGVAYIAFRYHAPTLFGLERTSLDFQTLNDVSTFSCAALLAWRSMQQSRRFLPRIVRDAIEDERSDLVWQKLAWAVGIGIHVGNYFHSAMGKMYIGGPEPLFWILNNPTAQAIAIGLHRLNGPLAGWPSLVQGYYDLLTAVVLPLNIFVFLIQFLSPIAILNRRLLILFTLAFDCMHLAIYFSLGAFFFFWIALNIIILLSLAAMRDEEFTPPVKMTAIACAIFGYLSFTQAGLGWLDGKKVVREVFYAETKDGRKVVVPPATFGLYSYQIAHGDLFIPDNHFKMRSGGNATYSDWKDASTCGPETVEKQRYVESVDEIQKLVAAADGFYRRHPWVKRLELYYFYPHHSPSNPAFFHQYDRTKLADVSSYQYVVESSCIGVQDGHLLNDVRIRSEYPLHGG